MSNDTVFRQANDSAKAEPAKEERKGPNLNVKEVFHKDTKYEDDATKVPVALHEELEGVPFTARYFDIEKIYDAPELGYFDDVKTIESAYRQKVQYNDIEDGEESYKQFIKEAEKATDSKDSPVSVKIAKIAEFLRFMQKMDKIDQERRRYSA